MKKLYVPIMNGNVTKENREKYFFELERASADHVFIALDRAAFFARGEKRAEYISSLAENISAFESRGFSVGVWIQAFGFGDILSGESKNVAEGYTRLRSVTGKEIHDSDMLCPENESFVSDYLAFVGDIVGAGCKMLMLDDDLCLSVRPGLGCFCEKHIGILEASLGESLSGKELYKLFFTGGKNRYRSAYLSVMGDTHRRFAGQVRDAVDKIDPTVRVGFCAGYTSWDIEGVTASELTKILAGNTKPFLRFTGAPYWAAKSVDRFSGMGLGAIIEEARAQEAYCRNEGIEIFFENDSYPRPRYATPSSMLECFALPLYANGGMGELGYFLDYHSSPDYEKGYIRHRIYNKPLYEFIEDNFSNKTPVGVRVCHEMRKLEESELPDTVNEKAVMRGHFNRGAELLSVHGIPTVYREESECAIALGEEARYIEKLPKKLITDATGARILKEKGIDTGYKDMMPTEAPCFEWFGSEKTLLPFSVSDGYFEMILDEDANVMSEFEINGKRVPSVYSYNSGGSEMLIFAFDTERIPHRAAVLLSYARGEQIARFCGGYPRIEKENGIYQLFKKGDVEDAVLFVNISDDPIIDGRITLSEKYSNAKICGAEGELSGDILVLSSVIPPYGAFAVMLKK